MNIALRIVTIALAGGVAAVCFGVIFNVPRRILGFVFLTGAAGQTVKQSGAALGLPPEAATFLGSVVVAVIAEILERVLEYEVPLFSVPGFIPLVPGVPAFHAVVSFASGNYPLGVEETVRAALITSAIGGGLGTVKALARIKEKPVV